MVQQLRVIAIALRDVGVSQSQQSLLRRSQRTSLVEEGRDEQLLKEHGRQLECRGEAALGEAIFLSPAAAPTRKRRKFSPSSLAPEGRCLEGGKRG